MSSDDSKTTAPVPAPARLHLHDVCPCCSRPFSQLSDFPEVCLVHAPDLDDAALDRIAGDPQTWDSWEDRESLEVDMLRLEDFRDKLPSWVYNYLLQEGTTTRSERDLKTELRYTDPLDGSFWCLSHYQLDAISKETTPKGKLVKFTMNLVRYKYPTPKRLKSRERILGMYRTFRDSALGKRMTGWKLYRLLPEELSFLEPVGEDGVDFEMQYHVDDGLRMGAFYKGYCPIGFLGHLKIELYGQRTTVQEEEPVEEEEGAS